MDGPTKELVIPLGGSGEFTARKGYGYRFESEPTANFNAIFQLHWDSGSSSYVHTTRADTSYWQESEGRTYEVHAIGDEHGGDHHVVLMITELIDDQSGQPSAMPSKIKASGAIDYFRDVDAYAFEVVAGFTYSILTRSEQYVSFDLSDAAGKGHLKADYLHGSAVWTAEFSGTIVASVKGHEGRYDLIVTENIPEVAPEVLPGIHKLSFERPGQIRRVSFDAPAHSAHRLSLQGIDEAWLRVIGPDGAVMPMGYLDSSQAFIPDLHVITQKPGRHILEIIPSSGGDGELTVAQFIDDQSGRPGWVNPSEPTEGKLDFRADEDEFLFHAEAFRSYRFRAEGAPLLLSTGLLYAPLIYGRSPMTHRYDYIHGEFYDVSWIPEKSGIHRLIIGAYASAWQPQAYSIKIESSPVTIPSDAPAIDESGVRDLIQAGEVRWYQFDARAGVRYQISGPNDSYPLQLHFMDIDGTVLPLDEASDVRRGQSVLLAEEDQRVYVRLVSSTDHDFVLAFKQMVDDFPPHRPVNLTLGSSITAKSDYPDDTDSFVFTIEPNERGRIVVMGQGGGVEVYRRSDNPIDELDFEYLDNEEYAPIELALRWMRPGTYRLQIWGYEGQEYTVRYESYVPEPDPRPPAAPVEAPVDEHPMEDDADAAEAMDDWLWEEETDEAAELDNAIDAWDDEDEWGDDEGLWWWDEGDEETELFSGAEE